MDGVQALLRSCLCLPDGFHQNGLVRIPLGDTAVVGTTTLIINDKGQHIVAKAFLSHNNSPNATIIVIKGANALKADMELQYLIQGDYHILQKLTSDIQKTIGVLQSLGRCDKIDVR